MSHIPVNHRLQPWYRLLGAACGLFVLVFGIVGTIRTAGDPLFHRGSATALGLKMNLAFGIISIVAGVIILGGALYGRNIDHYINLGGGIVFLIAGMLMLALLQTSANFLNFRIGTCVVSFVIGTVLLAAGLYGRTGDETLAQAEAHVRQHHVAPPPGSRPRPADASTDGSRFA